MEMVTDALMALLITMIDVMPIVAVILIFQIFVIRRPFPNWQRAVGGLFYIIFGLVIFLEGLELALFPIGTMMATQLTDPAFIYGGGIIPAEVEWRDYLWVYLFAATIGFASSIAEPAVIAVAMKVRDVSGGTISVIGLRLVVALGVAVGLVVGALKLVTGTPIHYLMIPLYLLLILQTWFAPRSIIPVAYDSGGVTTSIVTVPLVTAVGLGLASTLPGRSPLLDGFGLVAFACLFPIIMVMAYAQLSVWLAHRAQRVANQ
jgi:hypothetical protein